MLESLAAALARCIGVRARVAPPSEPRPEWYDPDRRQYRADIVLDSLVERRVDGRAWTLGILAGDLFVPGFNYVSGQATVDGCCAIIGLQRLRPEFNGEPADPARFERRVLTEAVHELGHVAGLGHCPDPRCALHFSSTVEDTDLKGPGLCNRCRRRVRSRLKG